MKVTIKKTGVKRVIDKNKIRLNKLQHPQKALNLATLLMRKWIDQNFVAEGRKHDNHALHWKDLSEFTLSLRRKGGKSHSDKILQDTGRLKTSWMLGANDKFGFVKSAVNYSGIHEYGKGTGRGSIPKRKIFPTQKQGEKIVLPAFEKFLEELAK